MRTPPRRLLLLLAAPTLLAACVDQPLQPTADAAPRLSSAAEHLPARTSNVVKYSDKGLKPATGRSGSATLTVRALLGRDGETTLEMTTGELDAATAAPGNISKLQVKPLGPDGEALYTRNFNGLSQGGYLQQSWAGVGRGSGLQVQANVEGIDPRRTGVITVTETVKMRPDVHAAALDAPQQAIQNVPVTVSAVVRERNGDVGARANCVLYVDEVEADRAEFLWVDAGGAVSCAFTPTFTTTGTRELSVRLESVVPADYDVGNNVAVATIEILSPVQPLTLTQFHGSVRDVDIQQNWRNWNTGVSPHHTTEWESAGHGEGRSQSSNIAAYFVGLVEFPVARIASTQTANGVLISSTEFENVAADVAYSGGDARNGYTSTCAYEHAFNPTAGQQWLQVCAHESWWERDSHRMSYVHAARQAGDVTYHSRDFARTWFRETGELIYEWTSNQSWDDVYGELVPRGADYQFTLDLDANGREFRLSSVGATFSSDQSSWSYDSRDKPNCSTSVWESTTYTSCYTSWGHETGLASWFSVQSR